MTIKHTHYEILGLMPNVSTLEIKQAYRKLVKDHHPDLAHSIKDHKKIRVANERMQRLNEAYSTLIDKEKRAVYDIEIGLSQIPNFFQAVIKPRTQEESHEYFLKAIFNPAKQAISRILNKYPEQLRKLSDDIYDEQLLAEFENYVSKLESELRRCSTMIASKNSPRFFEAAVTMMRHSIAQAADGLDEIHHFCQDFNYHHLTMAGNLFKIALELLRESAQLTRL